MHLFWYLFAFVVACDGVRVLPESGSPTSSEMAALETADAPGAGEDTTVIVGAAEV